MPHIVHLRDRSNRDVLAMAMNGDTYAQSEWAMRYRKHKAEEAESRKRNKAEADAAEWHLGG